MATKGFRSRSSGERARDSPATSAWPANIALSPLPPPLRSTCTFTPLRCSKAGRASGRTRLEMEVAPS